MAKLGCWRYNKAFVAEVSANRWSFTVVSHIRKCQAWICSGRIGLVMLQPIAKFLKNIPTKLFEYWACGLPVIVSDLPPIRPFLRDGKNGLSFDPTSAEDLGRAIAWLVRHPEECKRMGQYGQEQVHTSWNNDRQIKALVDLYIQICRR